MPIVLLLALIFTTILSAIEVGELKFSRPDYDTSFSANIEELYKIDGLLEKGMNYSVGLGKGFPLSEFDALLPTFLVTTGDFGVNYKNYSFAFSYSLANPDLGEIAGYSETGSIMLTNLNAGLIQKFRNCTFTPYASAGFQHWSPTPAEIKNKDVSYSSSSKSLFALGVGIKADYYFRRRGYIRNSKLTKISLSSLRFDLELSNTNVTTSKELDKGTFALLKLSYSMSLFSPSKTHLFSTVTPLQSRRITREFVSLPEDTAKPSSPSKFRPFITTVSAVVAIAAAAYGYGFNKECEEKLAAYKSAQGEAATANAWHDFTLSETKRNTSYSIAAWSLSVCLISLTF